MRLAQSSGESESGIHARTSGSRNWKPSGFVMTLERRTVRTHLSHIYRKMGVNSHVEAVVLALRAGIVDL